MFYNFATSISVLLRSVIKNKYINLIILHMAKKPGASVESNDNMLIIIQHRNINAFSPCSIPHPLLRTLTVHYTPLCVHLTVLDVRVLYSGIIVCDKQLLEELYRKRRLANTAISYHHQFVCGEVPAGGWRF